jgi:peptide/nickel transport system permease protein
MSAVAEAPGRPAAAPSAPAGTLRLALRDRRTQVGLTLFGLVVLIALLGPLFAPHDPAAIVGVPYQPPGGTAVLGTDFLGHDVLSRCLWGGRTVLWMSLAATTIGMALGVTSGLVAAYSRSWADGTIMRTMDVILAFPNIVLVLLVVALFGSSPYLIVLLVGIAWWPQVARVTRGVAVDVATRDFIRAAEILGISRRRILFRELLPNLATPLMVEFGVRLTWSVALIAALSFLGFGVQPPNADWGLMINENRQGIAVQPWGLVAPVLLIGIFTIGTNLIAEGIARSSARVQG